MIGLIKDRRKARYALVCVALSTVLIGGCFDSGPVDKVTIDPDGRLGLTVDSEGWRVAVPGEKDVHVTEEVLVRSGGAGDMVIVWSNEDDRFHEIMFHKDHSDDDAIQLHPGDTVERRVGVGFDRYVHSHHAPEMPEIRLRIVDGTDVP